MSEMTERMARAMYRQRVTELRIYEREPEKIEPAVESGYFLCVTEARAAIAAMREPTPAMIEAFRYAGPSCNDDLPSSGEDYWDAGIDAALAE